mgnify:CR=1 FL=1
MVLVPTSGPTVEPVSLAETKIHLRVTGTSEDLLIASLITAGRVHLELALACAFITQTWSWFLDDWPKRLRLDMPLGPVQSVAAIRVLTSGDVVTTLPAQSYLLTGRSLPPRLTLKERGYWSSNAPSPAYGANGIEIEFIAGFGDTAADVPSPIRQALLLLIAHWFEQRSPIEVGRDGAELPPMVAELTAPYRQVRL